MDLVPEKDDMKAYLKRSSIIDFQSQNIREIATILTKGLDNEIDITQKVYQHVRDVIKHSADISSSIVTCKASEVLEFKQGICCAKSHLLAAILRYLGIPTGFCYQGILFNIGGAKIVALHGINAVYLYSVEKWIRIDARGNKANVHAEFSIDQEKLAYKPETTSGEFDCPTIYSEPNKDVVDALQKYKSIDELMRNLPTKL